MAQTNQSNTNTLALIGSSDWPVGTRLVIDANRTVVRDTNFLIPGTGPQPQWITAPSTNLVAVPVATKVETLMNNAERYLSGALVVITALLGWLAKIKTDKASVVNVLIRAIESHNSPALKQAISAAALDAGVSDSLNKSVQAVTSNILPSPTPFPPAPIAAADNKSISVVSANPAPPAPVQPFPPA